MHNIFFQEILACWDELLMYLPGRSGRFIRYLMLKKRFKHCGRRISISHSVSFKGLKNIELGNYVRFGSYCSVFAESPTNESGIFIGNNVSLNRNVMLNADVKGTIVIEDDVMIGPNVVLRASGHNYLDALLPIRMQGHQEGMIKIGNGTWLGSNSVILQNVNIGKGAVVGAGAVVTKDVKDYEIVGGVPASSIGARVKDDENTAL